MLVCITNAGLDQDWQYETREAIRQNDRWHFSRLDGPVASWLSPENLSEQEKLLPSIAYRRLWLNEWTAGGGDWIEKAVLDRAIIPGLNAQSSAQMGFDYVAGVDLGVSRDASAVVILGVRRH